MCVSSRHSGRSLAIGIVFGYALLLGQGERALAGQVVSAPTGQQDNRAAELLDSVRRDNGEKLIASLAEFASAPQFLKENLSELLSIASLSGGEMADTRTVSRRTNAEWGSGAHTKGEYIAGAVLEPIRKSKLHTEMSDVLDDILSFFNSCVEGNIEPISPVFALEALFRATFPDYGKREIVAAPKMTPAREKVLALVTRAMSSKDEKTRTCARGLVLRAAYLLPAEREEFVKEIGVRLGKTAEADCRSNLARGLEAGELPTEEELAAMAAMPDEQLFATMKSRSVMSPMRHACFQTFVSRAKKDPSKLDALFKVFPEMFRGFGAGGDVSPGPVSQTASDEEKRYLDAVLDFYRRHIIGVSEDHRLAIEALPHMLVDDGTESRRYFEDHHQGPAKPYGFDKGLGILLDALQAEDPEEIRRVTRALGCLLWQDVETTSRILSALEKRLKYVEESVPEVRVEGNTVQDKINRALHEEKAAPREEIRNTIRLAKDTLSKMTAPHARSIVEQPVFDFGEKGNDTTVANDFSVHNTGTGPLTMRCYFTPTKSIQVPTTAIEIPAGESTVIHIDLDLRSFQGHVEERVVFETNSPDERQVELVFKGTVLGPIVTTPNVLDVGRIALADQPLTRKVQVWGAKPETTFQIKTLRWDGPMLKSEHTIVEIEPGKVYEISVTFTAAPVPGPFDNHLIIETDLPDARETCVPLRLYIERPGPSSLANQANQGPTT